MQGLIFFCPLMRYEMCFIWLGVLCRSISIKPEVDFVHSVLSQLVPLSFFCGIFFFLPFSGMKVIGAEPHQVLYGKKNTYEVRNRTNMVKTELP